MTKENIIYKKKKKLEHTLIIEEENCWQEVASDKGGTGTLHPTSKSSPNVITGPCPATHAIEGDVPSRAGGDVGCRMA